VAFKVVRQPTKIALVGCASSAAALAAGAERAPEALRAAGLAERLKALGFEVSDFGDTAVQMFQTDDEHPRARNVSAVLKSLQDLRPRVEAAVKSGALPLILCGDSVAVMAAIAGARRYYRMASLIYLNHEADLQVPATTPDGSIDGMVISQIMGRGAPELTRFWGEPPLVREPDVTLFGYDRLSSIDEQYLSRSPSRHYSAPEIAGMGGAAAARAAVQRIAAAKHEFILHFGVDVISRGEFLASGASSQDALSSATADGAGLHIRDLREALREFARQPTLAAMDVAGYNPTLDPDGDGARRLVELLADVLSARLAPEPAIGATSPAPVLSQDENPPTPQVQGAIPENGSPSDAPEL
jgi:arginase